MNGKSEDKTTGTRLQLAAAALLWMLVAGCKPDQDLGIEGVGSLSGQDEAPLYAVRASDYTSTSIALLNPDGSMLDEAFFHSGSVPAGLTSALSGDVALPTDSGDGTHLTTLDRVGADLVTRIDVESGEVLGQVKTHTPAKEGEESFSSNPQDYIYVDEDSAWVTRFGVDPSRNHDDVDRGSDVLQLDPSDFKRTGEHIDLSEFDSEGTVENPDTGETEQVAIYARPERMVRIGEHHAVVGLARLSLGYDAIGSGMVALADLEARSAEGFELEELENCGQVVPIPGDDTRVAISCVGFFRGVPRDGAGIAVLKLEDSSLSMERVWRARDDEDSPISVYGLTALSDSLVLAVAAGITDSDTPNDRLFQIDLESGEQTLVFEADGAYTIGDGAYNPKAGLVMVPDGSTDGDGKPTAGVRLFTVDDELSLEPDGVVKVDAVLPVRQVKAL